MILKSNHLKVKYDNQTIINDMTIEIPEGKITVILGENGCGKSTLLKSFTRLLTPKNGEILLNNKNIHDYQIKKLATHLGMLSQTNDIVDNIKVIDLVSRGRYPHIGMFESLSKDDYDKIYEAISLMDIEDLVDKNINELSGGQRQRVWIALALAQDTDILLLDEPTTYLDVSYSLEILDALVKINKEKNKTIVMVLHDINLAARYADHIIALKKGELITQGAPNNIITSSLIENIYNLKNVIIEDPIHHSPLIIPLSNSTNK